MGKIFWVLLIHSIACHHRVRLKTFLLLTVNINVIVLLIASLVLKKDQGYFLLLIQLCFISGQFAELHDNMKSVMASELEVIVQGDK